MIKYPHFSITALSFLEARFKRRCMELQLHNHLQFSINIYTYPAFFCRNSVRWHKPNLPKSFALWIIFPKSCYFRLSPLQRHNSGALKLPFFSVDGYFPFCLLFAPLSAQENKWKIGSLLIWLTCFWKPLFTNFQIFSDFTSYFVFQVNDVFTFVNISSTLSSIAKAKLGKHLSLING